MTQETPERHDGATGATSSQSRRGFMFKVGSALLGVGGLVISAPIVGYIFSPAVKDFFRAAFSCVFIEGWGMTETAASGTLCHPSDATNGHVGLPCSCVELKLVDVADMDYRTDVGVKHPMAPPSVPQV